MLGKEQLVRLYWPHLHLVAWVGGNPAVFDGQVDVLPEVFEVLVDGIPHHAGAVQVLQKVIQEGRLQVGKVNGISKGLELPEGIHLVEVAARGQPAPFLIQLLPEKVGEGFRPAACPHVFPEARQGHLSVAVHHLVFKPLHAADQVGYRLVQSKLVWMVDDALILLMPLGRLDQDTGIEISSLTIVVSTDQHGGSAVLTEFASFVMIVNHGVTDRLHFPRFL